VSHQEVEGNMVNRILIINSEFPPVGGGAGNASAHIATKLTELGYDITILTSRFANYPNDIVQDGYRLIRIRAGRRKKDRSSPFEQLFFLFSATLHAISLIRTWKPDAIVSFFGIPCGAVAWIIKGFTGIPYLVSLRGGDVPGFRPYDFALYHRLVSPILHRIWRQADFLIANSQGLQKLATRFDKEAEIQVITNGVDLDMFSVPKNRKWESPRLLFVGRLVYQKGIDILIKALGRLKDYEWRLDLVGDGPHLPDLERLAKDFGIAERIKYRGWVDKEVIIDEYSSANLFVFPSRHEGMPNAVLEAMACGLPVVATDIAGNEELVIQGETGFLIPPENPDALSDVLRNLFLDPLMGKKMGMESRRRVENYYSWDGVASQYARILQTMIGKS
jgi:glycosyltransferase involved in cell wall biosynthesis